MRIATKATNPWMTEQTCPFCQTHLIEIRESDIIPRFLQYEQGGGEYTAYGVFCLKCTRFIEIAVPARIRGRNPEWVPTRPLPPMPNPPIPTPPTPRT